jgi:hypothetical protein
MGFLSLSRATGSQPRWVSTATCGSARQFWEMVIFIPLFLFLFPGSFCYIIYASSTNTYPFDGISPGNGYYGGGDDYGYEPEHPDGYNSGYEYDGRGG